LFRWSLSLFFMRLSVVMLRTLCRMHVLCALLPTANCQLPTANCQLSTVNCQLPTV
jgi:hypothetical protein